ncbi:alanine racemase [Leucobacter japonicus]|uniref:alanine racemase n=1 Tax=Leucobacter japonicus TaxID=1461259 RepID=UPI0027B919AB|nr:alanine racemase [Leucobacter japonicus]
MANPMVTEPVAEVDLDAIAANIRVLTELAPTAELMAVVKADGYGHGAIEVGRAALAAGATSLGVATIPEALALRAAGITAPVLSWLSTSGYAEAISANVRLGVNSPRQLAAVAAAAREVGRPVEIDVKVDTGLSRNGVTDAELPELLRDLGALVAEGAVRVHGLFSHLSHADVPDHPLNSLQLERLLDARAQFTQHGIAVQQMHLGNSGTALARPDLHLDVLRPGLAMYGYSPFDEPSERLTPAMTLKAPLTLMKRVQSGDGVSYGHTWTAPHDTTLGLVPLGYADGVPRIMSGKFDVVIGDSRYPSVGRVCMDQFVIDLGDHPRDVAEGDEVLLFGPSLGWRPNAREWADAAGTISWEVLTSIGSRVPRGYVRSGAY